MKTEKVKYLVRHLTIINSKGMENVHLLVYFEAYRLLDDSGVERYTDISIRPFDFERAGYEYMETLSLDMTIGK